MKIAATIAKILAAVAAVAGAVYLIATYGDKIVAWAKKILGCTCCEEAAEECCCEESAEECCCEETCCEEASEEIAEEVIEEAISYGKSGSVWSRHAKLKALEEKPLEGLSRWDLRNLIMEIIDKDENTGINEED